jgi:hypothetical protein
VLSLLSSPPSIPPIGPGPGCGGKVGGALEVFVKIGGCMSEGELALEGGVAPGGILRMKFMAPLGFDSARLKRPVAAATEGGNGAGGWAWKFAAVRVKVLDVLELVKEFVRAG